MKNDASDPTPPRGGGKYMDELRQLVLDFLASDDVAVYLFGSRARADNDPGSDVDIAVLPRSSFDGGKLTRLRTTLEDSNIPYKVDVLNLLEVSETFREAVLREGILWKD